MKKENDKSKVEKENDKILKEMMKNPGVAYYMKIYNKYSKAIENYNSYYKIMYKYFKNRSCIQNTTST